MAVTGLQVSVQLGCVSCPLNFSATSSGNIAGVDGTTPYDATWTALNMSATGTYGSSCAGPVTGGVPAVWTGAALQPSTATVQGVQLHYGTSTFTATVTLTFGGNIVEGAFVPATKQIDITGGPSPISVVNQGIPGSMPIIPPVPTVPCPTGTQTFTANGTFLTLGAAT
ncbi:MAG TPA: hypothetical protein VN193_10055 [Candidatus Angelobacter sp.]|nr:hypothetical protein [Candidatus Angelobacter sp.]